MKRSVLLAALLLGVLAAPVQAQHGGHGAATTAAAATELTDGEVRRIDKAKGTVMLKHGEIKNLGMGAMTMGFKLKDPKLAEDLNVGDKVRFAAEQKGDDLIVTTIEKVK